MKARKLVPAILLTVTLLAVSTLGASAEEGSITITISRKTMPQSLLHPGRFFTKAETLTVHDYVIRDYLGRPIESFAIQTASGLTKIPVDTVKEIHFNNWLKRRTEDVYLSEFVVQADMLMTDGSEMNVLMNPDFGTIEGKTELGEFFLKDPHTIRRLVFNRIEELVEPPEVIEPPEAPEVVEIEEVAPPPDSDGDGVPDYRDKCPDTPMGAPVNGSGCWTVKGIRFDYNKWDIRPEYNGVLDENVRVLQKNPAMTIEVQGHTDEIASEEYNQVLSEKRAVSTKAYFILRGISADRISTRGFGESRPIASNDTPEARALNRRIEIKIKSR